MNTKTFEELLPYFKKKIGKATIIFDDGSCIIIDVKELKDDMQSWVDYQHWQESRY